MGRLFRKFKSILGVLLLVLSICFFLFWELEGRNSFMYKEVVVLKDSMRQGTLVTQDLLMKTYVDASSIVENSVNDESVVLGLEAKHFVPKNSQIVREYFDSPEIVVDDNEKIMKLPENWLYSFPQTLRRKDIVYFYPVSGKGQGQVMYKEPVVSAVVAYVKDSANREVLSIDESRLVGSSVISSIEVILSQEDFRYLEEYVNKGFSFTLMYQ